MPVNPQFQSNVPPAFIGLFQDFLPATARASIKYLANILYQYYTLSHGNFHPVFIGKVWRKMAAPVLTLSPTPRGGRLKDSSQAEKRLAPKSIYGTDFFCPSQTPSEWLKSIFLW